MSSTWRGSISIEIPEAGAVEEGARRARWARVDLDDFFWVGRCSICNLRIQGDTQVSRLHATIHRDGDGYQLTDMQSRNGTSVNGKKISSIRLVPGDRVRVGQTLFEFEPEGGQDTVFQEGTSRVIGSADVELKSFPSSIDMDVAHVPGGFALHEVHAPAIDPVASAAAAPGPAASRPSPRSSSLEAFATIVIDRLVCELQARVGAIHLPSVGEREALTVARGMVDGHLDVLTGLEPELRRVVMQLQPVPADDTPGKDGERLVWRRGMLEARLAPHESAPRPLGEGWGFTIALPRVGRWSTHDPLPERTTGLAWIHVEDARRSKNVARLVAETAAAVNVSVIRFLERGGA